MILNNLYDDLKNRKKKIAVVGLGYVGLPLLISLDEYFDTIGYDKSNFRIESLKIGIDKDNNVKKSKLKKIKSYLCYKESILCEASFIIIAVPTPIYKNNRPDLSFLEKASKAVGRNLQKNSIIVYESTVYPGLTEEFCIPILEKYSGLKNLTDFFVGYSPERINPGDTKHELKNTVKIVAAQNERSLDIISKVYSRIVKAGIHKTSSIKVAEAAKIIENTQRDLNIALINELSIIFSKLGLDTKEVLEAAETKWNFLKFYPGLVGGHCIGVDPYYLTYKAKKIGYDPKVILAGRKVNDEMHLFIGNKIIEKIRPDKYKVKKPKVVIFGITFKENVSDFRNSKVIELYIFLLKNNFDVQVYDPIVNRAELEKVHNIRTIELENIKNADLLVFSVAHNCFKNIDFSVLRSKMAINKPYLLDIKWLFNKKDIENNGFKYWRL